MEKITIKNYDFNGKKVLLRTDYNVPLNEYGIITSDKRIKESLQTINYLLAKGASVIIISHLGRTNGKPIKKYSLLPCAKKLAELLHHEVKFSNDTIGPTAMRMVEDIKPGEILMLENLRFQPEEEENSAVFARKIASYADVYVNDAFSVSHRKHASVVAITKYLPSYVGFLVEKELKNISQALEVPERPFVAILGGAKVSDKLGVIDSLIDKCNTILIGGAMAYTFLKAKGFKVAKSKVENDLIETAKDIIKKAEEKNVNIVLPIDNIYANKISDPKIIKCSKDENIPSGMIGVDIGKKSIKLFKKHIKGAKTVIWNGPLGVFENKKFATGTYKIAKAVSKCKGLTIVGGGDSASAIINMGFENKISHISTGGGASLKMFEGKKLVGIEAVENSHIIKEESLKTSKAKTSKDSKSATKTSKAK